MRNIGVTAIINVTKGNKFEIKEQSVSWSKCSSPILTEEIDAQTTTTAQEGTSRCWTDIFYIGISACTP